MRSLHTYNQPRSQKNIHINGKAEGNMLSAFEFFKLVKLSHSYLGLSFSQFWSRFEEERRQSRHYLLLQTQTRKQLQKCRERILHSVDVLTVKAKNEICESRFHPRRLPSSRFSRKVKNPGKSKYSLWNERQDNKKHLMMIWYLNMYYFSFILTLP